MEELKDIVVGKVLLKNQNVKWYITLTLDFHKANDPTILTSLMSHSGRRTLHHLIQIILMLCIRLHIIHHYERLVFISQTEADRF